MNQQELTALWKAEEDIAYIHGWDFSHIAGRYTEQDDLPWDYLAVIGEYLRPEMKILEEKGSIGGSIHRFMLVAQKMRGSHDHH